MNIIELTAAVFTLISVYYTVKKSILCWPTGILAVTAYGTLFFREKLYADMTLQIVFFIQCVYGWIRWNETLKKNDEKIIKLDTIDHNKYICAFFILFPISHWILKTYTDASIPLFDSMATTLSIIANWMLVKKELSTWSLWITADVVYIGMFIYKDLYLSSLLYLILLFMAINGYKKWKLMYERQAI